VQRPNTQELMAAWRRRQPEDLDLACADAIARDSSHGVTRDLTTVVEESGLLKDTSVLRPTVASS
jgi:hypothetical protein